MGRKVRGRYENKTKVEVQQMTQMEKERCSEIKMVTIVLVKK